MESEFHSNWLYAGNIKNVTRKFKADVADNKIANYKAHVKIAFTVER